MLRPYMGVGEQPMTSAKRFSFMIQVVGVMPEGVWVEMMATMCLHLRECKRFFGGHNPRKGSRMTGWGGAVESK